MCYIFIYYLWLYVFKNENFYRLAMRFFIRLNKGNVRKREYDRGFWIFL